MALHKDFPDSPHGILDPEVRWFPADEALRASSFEELLSRVPLKMDRLRQCCEDINKAQACVKYDFVYVDEESFNKYKPTSFKDLAGSFNEYKK